MSGKSSYCFTVCTENMPKHIKHHAVLSMDNILIGGLGYNDSVGKSCFIICNNRWIVYDLCFWILKWSRKTITVDTPRPHLYTYFRCFVWNVVQTSVILIDRFKCIHPITAGGIVFPCQKEVSGSAGLQECLQLWSSIIGNATFTLLAKLPWEHCYPS